MSRESMSAEVKLHVRALEPEVVAPLEALLAAVEDVRPLELGRRGELSREEFVTLRERTAELLWNGQTAAGQLPLRRLHRESRWQTPTDASPDEFVRVHQGMALIDMLDILIAGLRGHDRVEVELPAGAADG
jgi:hypothetical protein